MPTSGTASAASGVISLVLLTAVVVLGVLLNRRRLGPLSRYDGIRLHQNLSLLTLAFLALHIATAIASPYGGLGPASAVVPFLGPRDRGWLALGVIASDLAIALVVTSLLRRRLGRRAWQAVHWLAYACWPAALAHSVGTGIGMRSGRLFDLAVGCMIAVLGAVAWRLAAPRRLGSGAQRRPGDQGRKPPRPGPSPRSRRAAPDLRSP